MIRLNKMTKHYRSITGRKKVIYKEQTIDIPMDRDVAVLGRNGAGKSTLIRLIGGIEKPSSGTIDTELSISWPLGLGTGIQGKLTGRQNTEFVCRVYGIENVEEAHAYVQDFSEIGQNYDEIVANYSSGMKSKLAFGISIMIRFDVLLLDEVLSVGDARFKKKCETVLNELRDDGSRILLVSHSEQSVRKMCQAGLVVNDGQLEYIDDIETAIKVFNGNLHGKN
ncbi:ABC transporter ATP-binding protein [Vibrio sp. D431a]|uniref:ABC transporter ATP-binding protein n=1 Tax=Vibrio sp. D431a TaxID=2837388 RepID=UPI002557C635|nr:ABC transporter ATP-binding protein [Vibrio sp. D431a]MDK9790729.1 ABC transporter ATP-binding protein [Vibrio sp. D431a]